LLARVNGLRLDNPLLLDAAVATGADVPVCLDPRPRVMHGIGEILSQQFNLPKLPAVLVNPRVTVATRDVFAVLGLSQGQARGAAMADPPKTSGGYQELLCSLATQMNDLEPAAIKIQPIIADVLAALRATSGCRLARMSGSGATCFALFGSKHAADAAARQLRAARPDWWVRSTMLG
jgi:4-diphosphocytidyl-2-C-methyl-D-erythritol kinase